MYCPNCKTLISDNEKFCPNCGKPADSKVNKKPKKIKSAVIFYSILAALHVFYLFLFSKVYGVLAGTRGAIGLLWTVIISTAASIFAEVCTEKLLRSITERKIQKLQKKLYVVKAQADKISRANALPSNIDVMTGTEFENFCAQILSRNGFSCVQLVGGADDKGVDITATKDGVKYAIQCKRYSSQLDNTAIQEVFAGKQFYGCHVGVVMTNSNFTDPAQAYADRTGVLLWERGWLISHNMY